MKIFANQRIAMRFPTQGINNNVCLARMIVHLKIIVIDHLSPSSLAYVQLKLSKDVLETFMICVNITHIAKQIVPPNL
jgi:hypothetical protein